MLCAISARNDIGCSEGARSGALLAAAVTVGAIGIAGMTMVGASGGDAFTIAAACPFPTGPDMSGATTMGVTDGATTLGFDPGGAAGHASGAWASCLPDRRDGLPAGAAVDASAGSVAFKAGAGAAPTVAIVDEGAGSKLKGAAAAPTADSRFAPTAVAAKFNAWRKLPEMSPVAGVDDRPAAGVALRNGLAAGETESGVWT